MARARNPRRVLRELMKPARDRLKILADRWEYKGRRTVYLDEHERIGREYTRARRPEEYPENDIDEWQHAYNVVTAAIRELEQAREHIVREYRALEARQGEPAI